MVLPAPDTQLKVPNVLIHLDAKNNVVVSTFVMYYTWGFIVSHVKEHMPESVVYFTAVSGF